MRNPKRNLSIGIVGAIIVAIVFFIVFPSDHLGNFNSLKIIDNGIIEKDKLLITVRTEGNPDVQVYEHGIEHTIPEVYGPNDWYISYKDSLFAKSGHWKYNWRDNHDYNLTFYARNTKLFCILNIKGQDGLIDTVELVPDRTKKIKLR